MNVCLLWLFCVCENFGGKLVIGGMFVSVLKRYCHPKGEGSLTSDEDHTHPETAPFRSVSSKVLEGEPMPVTCDRNGEKITISPRRRMSPAGRACPPASSLVL